MDFTPKRAIEQEVFTVNFVNKLLPGETIQSAVWSVTVAAGTDANPSAMIQGAAAINGSAVSQIITGGVPGVRYAPICTAHTATQVLVLPVYGDGLLEVTL
jgi:hypothetical protein